MKLTEHHLYGSSRLGVRYADTTLYQRSISINGFDSLGNILVDEVLDSTRLEVDTVNYYYTIAKKQYELSNHLGNVLATVLDRKTPIYGKEVIYNTEFTGTTDGWTGGWSEAGSGYPGVTPPYTTVSLDGGNRLRVDATKEWGGARKVINTVIGKEYTISVDINQGNANMIVLTAMALDDPNIFLGTYLKQYGQYTSGRYSITFEALTSQTQIKIEKSHATATYFYIDNVVVEEASVSVVGGIADVTQAQYYYPFGAPLKTWNTSNDKYRFGFNGQEKDNEVAGDGNSYTAEFWQYDARLGRRWNIDPVIKPWQSGYSCFSGNSILRVDPKGDDDVFNTEGKYLYSTSSGRSILVQTNDGEIKELAQIKFSTYGNGFGTKEANQAITNIIQHYRGEEKDVVYGVEKSDRTYATHRPNTNFIDISLNKNGNVHKFLTNRDNFKSILFHEHYHKNKKNDQSANDAFSIQGRRDHLETYLAQFKDNSFWTTSRDFKANQFDNAESLIFLLRKNLESIEPNDPIYEQIQTEINNAQSYIDQYRKIYKITTDETKK
jgi:hypothetical protein